MRYFFVPGRIPELSLEELRAVFDRDKVSYSSFDIKGAVIIVETETDESQMKDIFDGLGGFVKYGKIISDPFTYIDKFTKSEDRVPFAMSSYSKDLPRRESQKLGFKIKKFLKKSGVSCRFVSNPRQKVTSSVLIEKNNVLEDGFEINNFGPDSWGVTLSIQDFEAFSKRDYGRPRSNKQKGMLPPKLARIMVNLSKLPKGSIIWDPFCGSGTVLMEARLLGYKIAGSDVDANSVEETKENLNWLQEEFGTPGGFRVFHKDIKSVSKDRIKYDAIVTEPHLGPVLRNVIESKRAKSIINQLRPIYDSLTPLLKPNSVVVVPSFNTHSDWIDMEYEVQGLKSQTLHWSRPHSIIRRIIKIFR